MGEINTHELLKGMVIPVEDILYGVGGVDREQAEVLLGILLNKVIELIPDTLERDKTNQFIIAFASLIHICNDYNIDNSLAKDDLEKDLSIIYERICDEKLVSYLKILENNLYESSALNRAIDIYDEYEIPYYFKILLRIEKLGIVNVDELHKLEQNIKDEILHCWNNIDDLRLLLFRKYYNSYEEVAPLKLLDEIVDYDFEDVLPIIKD